MQRTMRFISICFAGLMLAGCAEGAGSFGGFGGGPAPRPKVVEVSDFVFGDGVVAVDRSFTARLERKVGSFPTFERKTRTAERVNDEIVAAIVVTLREAGLDAQPGNDDTVDGAVMVSGRLRPSDPEAAKNNQTGFGSGRSGVVADMTVTRSKRQLLAFAAEGAKKPGPAPAGKAAVARNAMYAESLAASKAASEKLSPDVEAQARSLGRAIGEKVAGYAKEQGWLNRPEGADTVAAAPGSEPRVRLPDPKPEQKPAANKKPAKPAAPPPDADDDPDAPPGKQ